jgi:hypothetical protein
MELSQRGRKRVMKFKANSTVFVVATKMGLDGKPQVVTKNGHKRKFQVISSGNRFTKLTCLEEGSTIRVENTRIRPEEQGEPTMPDKATPPPKPKAVKKASAKPKPAKKTVKKKQAVAAAAKIEKVNLKDFKKNGHEVWINDFSDTFNSETSDGKKIKAQAVCIIFKDKKKSKHFNLFDGTLGRVQVGARAKRKDKKTKKMIETIKQFGTEYNISNYDRKIKELKKKGYKRYTAAV